jgi:S-phase kinase-associated protein 1
LKQVSNEGDSFQVPTEVAKMSTIVKYMVGENFQDDGSEILLPEVTTMILQKVIEFCQHYREEPMYEIEKPIKSTRIADLVQNWYADYVDVEQVVLFELINAANYMEIQPLVDLGCATIASMIKGKTPDEIRKTFKLVNESAPE